MKTLKNIFESVGSFPSISEFVKHPILRGFKLFWSCAGLCADNKALIQEIGKEYNHNTLLYKEENVCQITGISICLLREGKQYRVEMYFEGIQRGLFTAVGVQVPNYDTETGGFGKPLGVYDKLPDAKKAAYEFLSQFNNDPSKFTKMLELIAKRKPISINTTL